MLNFGFAIQDLKSGPQKHKKTEKEIVQKVLGAIPAVKEGYLKASGVNVGLSLSEYYDYLFDFMELIRFPKGSAIFHKGDSSSFFGVILTGKVAMAVPLSQNELELRAKVSQDIQEKQKEKLNKKKRPLELVITNAKLDLEKLLPKAALPELFEKSTGETGARAVSLINKFIPLKKSKQMGCTTEDFMLLGIGKQHLYLNEDGVILFKVFRMAFQGEEIDSSIPFPETSHKRDKTAFAFEDSLVGVLPKKALETITTKKIEDEKCKLRCLTQVFPSINCHVLKKVSEMFKEHAFPTRQVVFSVRQPASNIFFLVSGEIDILHKVHYKVTSQNIQESSFRPLGTQKLEIRSARLQPEEIFGMEDIEWFGFGGNGVRKTTAVSVCAQTRVLSLSIENFLKIENSTEKIVTDKIMEKIHVFWEMRREKRSIEGLAKPFRAFIREVYNVLDEEVERDAPVLKMKDLKSLQLPEQLPSNLKFRLSNEGNIRLRMKLAKMNVKGSSIDAIVKKVELLSQENPQNENKKSVYQRNQTDSKKKERSSSRNLGERKVQDESPLLKNFKMGKSETSFQCNSKKNLETSSLGIGENTKRLRETLGLSFYSKLNSEKAEMKQNRPNSFGFLNLKQLQEIKKAKKEGNWEHLRYNRHLKSASLCFIQPTVSPKNHQNMATKLSFVACDEETKRSFLKKLSLRKKKPKSGSNSPLKRKSQPFRVIKTQTSSFVDYFNEKMTSFKANQSDSANLSINYQIKGAWRPGLFLKTRAPFKKSKPL